MQEVLDRNRIVSLMLMLLLLMAVIAIYLPVRWVTGFTFKQSAILPQLQKIAPAIIPVSRPAMPVMHKAITEERHYQDPPIQSIVRDSQSSPTAILAAFEHNSAPRRYQKHVKMPVVTKPEPVSEPVIISQKTQPKSDISLVFKQKQIQEMHRLRHALIHRKEELYPIIMKFAGSKTSQLFSPYTSSTLQDWLKTRSFLPFDWFAIHSPALITLIEDVFLLEQIYQKLPLGVPFEGDIRVTSHYGMRNDPFTKKRKMHYGIDFGMATGRAIRAVTDGVVKFAQSKGGYGLLVIIEHAGGYQSYYAHLSRISVKPGAKIKQGQVIGHSGNTGRSTGPHLHYALKRDGKFTNPHPFLWP